MKRMPDFPDRSYNKLSIFFWIVVWLCVVEFALDFPIGYVPR